MTSENVTVTDQQALVIELMQSHGVRRSRRGAAPLLPRGYGAGLSIRVSCDPRVGRRALDGMIAAGEVGAGMLAPERYDVSRWIPGRRHRGLPSRWHAELAKDAGPVREGQRLGTQRPRSLHSARRDEIIRQEAYGLLRAVR